MTKKTYLATGVSLLVLLLTGVVQRQGPGPSIAGFGPSAAEASDFDGDPIAARQQADVVAMKRFRPGYPFWENIFTIRDGYIVFGSAADGRALVAFPAAGDWTRSARWYDRSLANLLKGRELPRSLDERREYVARLLQAAVGPVLHNETRGDFAAPGIRRYGSFFGDWSAIYQRFGVPGEIGLAQALLESGFEGRRRSEADAVGLCQWLETNWDQLDRLDPGVIESGNQTTQAAYCGAYLSVLATKYGSFIPALSEHHAGATNVGRILVNGSRLGGGSPRERYFLGAELARDLRSIGRADYSDIYVSYGPRSYRYAEIVFGNTFAIGKVLSGAPQQAIHAMRTTRTIPIAEVAQRTRLSVEEIRRFNPALVSRVPAGATLYLPAHDASFGRDVAFWHRPATAEYQSILEEFVRLDVQPEAWDRPAFQPTLKDFVRRFRATDTEEGTVMATVLEYVRRDAATSGRRRILADYQQSDDIRALFERGVSELDVAAPVAAE